MQQEEPEAGAQPLTAAQTTPESPWPLRVLSEKLKAHIERAPEAWIEGQCSRRTSATGTPI